MQLENSWKFYRNISLKMRKKLEKPGETWKTRFSNTTILVPVSRIFAGLRSILNQIWTLCTLVEEVHTKSCSEFTSRGVLRKKMFSDSTRDIKL